jgi:serine protease Do
VRNLTPDIAKQLSLPAGTAGVLVQGIRPGSPAEAVDLQPGDVIIQINRQAVGNTSDFKRLAAKVGKKDNVMLRIIRNGSKLFIVIKP